MRRISALVIGLAFIVLLSAPVQTEAQFVIGPPLATHEYERVATELYDFMLGDVNERFDVPTEVILTSAPCGQPNAFYVPDSDANQPHILLCSELIDTAVRQAQNLTPPGEGVIAIVSPLLFSVFHEVGHALIDVLDLPILGQEEDAADQLAVLMLNEEPVMAMLAAQQRNRTTRGFSPQILADAHDLDQQRFYNIHCWIYGADPLTRGYIVEGSGLPPERARRCQGEFDQLRSAWERLLGDQLTGDFGQAVRNTTGSWRFVESMADNDFQARCSASGTVTLMQLLSVVSGTMEQEGSCVYFGVPRDNAAPPTPITTGEVTNSGISFRIADCVYDGVFEDDSRMALSGSVMCTSDLPDGSILELAGTWRAVR